MRKPTLQILASSILSSFIAVSVFYFIQTPDTIIIREEPNYTLVKNEKDYRPVFSEVAIRSTESIVFLRIINKDSQGTKSEYRSSTGSGVIVSPEGHIVTNYHLIEDADIIEVTLNDKRVFKANVVGIDRNTDLSLLKIEVQNLKQLKFGDSDSLSIGDWVLAIGNPFKLQSSVTAGIVSAKARNLNLSNQYSVESYIQTDAVVNPGNSGGALVNMYGELIGINTAILSNSGKYEGFSFAIPSNIVSKVVGDLIEYGSVQRAWLGVGIADVDDDIAKSLGLNNIQGVIIQSVSRGSAAQKASLVKGDVIISLNGTKTNSIAEFNGVLARFRPGEYMTVEYIHEGIYMKKDIILRNHLNTTELLPIRKDEVLQSLGFELRDLSSHEKYKYNIEGVKVISVYKNGLVDRVSMEPNYIITSINRLTFTDVATLISYLDSEPTILSFEGFYPEYPGSYPYKVSR